MSVLQDPLALRPAGFWLRLIALAIDTGVLVLVMGGLGLAFDVKFAALTPTDTEMAAIRLWQAIGMVVGWLYYAGMESSGMQATLGKMAMGIYVSDLAGDRIGFGRASLRYWAKVISSVILLIGFLMAAFTRRKQALHDIIASCLVLKR